MAKKAVGKMVGKRADQYMLRFPDGMRENLAKLAAANGRSMNTEIIAALEKHLERASDIETLVQKFEELWEAVRQIQRHFGFEEISPSPYEDS